MSEQFPKSEKGESSHGLRERIMAGALVAGVFLAPEVTSAHESYIGHEDEPTPVTLVVEEGEDWQQFARESMQSLRGSMGEKKTETIESVLEEMSLENVARELAKMSGVSSEDILERATISRLVLLSGDEWEDFIERNNFPENLVGHAGAGGVITLSAESLFWDGVASKEELRRRLLHEWLHQLTMRQNENDEVVIPWVEEGVPPLLGEGMTEWLAQRLYKELYDEYPEAYSYHGGSTVGAYLVERMIERQAGSEGVQELWRSFVEQDTSAFRSLINSATRSGGFASITRKRGPSIIDPETGKQLFVGGDATTLFQIIRLCAEQGLPYQQWINESSDWLSEHIEVIEESNGHGDDEKEVTGVLSIDPHPTSRGVSVVVRGVLAVKSLSVDDDVVVPPFYLNVYSVSGSAPDGVIVESREEQRNAGEYIARLVQSYGLDALENKHFAVPVGLGLATHSQTVLQEFRSVVVSEGGFFARVGIESNKVATALRHELTSMRDVIQKEAVKFLTQEKGQDR